MADLGELPAELQMETIYSVKFSRQAKDPEIGTSLVNYLSGSQVATVLKEGHDFDVDRL
jgi:hypothetical protein